MTLLEQAKETLTIANYAGSKWCDCPLHTTATRPLLQAFVEMADVVKLFAGYWCRAYNGDPDKTRQCGKCYSCKARIVLDRINKPL